YTSLSPRHLRATNTSFFVHARKRPQTTPAAGGRGINTIKKIVQICALLCSAKNRGNQAKKP
ncbi:MAG: hypothetical protein DBX59_00255, partial [Bacillota bacterium]